MKKLEIGKSIDFQEAVKGYDVRIFDRYEVEIETLNKFLGGWPKDPSIELTMLESRHKKGKVPDEVMEAAREKVKEAASSDPEEETEKANLKAWTGFKSDDAGLIIESRQIKAGFKETATVMGLTNVLRGTKNILQHLFFIRGLYHPDLIHMYRDGEIITDPDGFEQLIAHVTTAQGPRSTIKFHDYLDPGVRFKFEVWFNDPQSRRVNEEFVIHCLNLCQDNGFGCSRSQGYGRVKILTIKKLAEGTLLSSKRTKEDAAKKKAEAEEKARKKAEAAAKKASKAK